MLLLSLPTFTKRLRLLGVTVLTTWSPRAFPIGNTYLAELNSSIGA